jgi:hypothetical protein
MCQVFSSAAASVPRIPVADLREERDVKEVFILLSSYFLGSIYDIAYCNVFASRNAENKEIFEAAEPPGKTFRPGGTLDAVVSSTGSQRLEAA